MLQRIYVLTLLGCGLALLGGCAGKSGSHGGFGTGSGSGASLAVTMSASHTCGGAGGAFSHIYLTVSDVQVSPNASALPGDPSFVDLTPGLKNQPVQVDLLATAQCFVTTLASNLTLAPGPYAQVRVVLVPDSSSFIIPANKCGLSANCVIFSGDVNTPHPIQLGTETTQGIQIGPNQIAGGSFNASGQSQTLGLSFDACASLVALGSNQFRLRPVIFAGDTSNAASISGQLVDSATLQPVLNGQFTVALEQKDNRLVDRVMMETVADSQGRFTLCPVPAGSFDVVASGRQTSTTATYAATATLGTPAGTNLSQLPVAVVNAAASFHGAIELQGVSQPPASADVTISALQLVTQSGLGSVNLTIPLLQSPAGTLTLPTLAGCAPATPCALFDVAVPPANVIFGQFNPSGTTYSQSPGLVSYSVEGTPFVALSGASPDCSPSFASVAVSNVTAGTSQDLSAQPLSFSVCQ